MWTGTIHYPHHLDSDELAEHLATCLRQVRARNVMVNGSRVTFTGGMFRAVLNTNILVPFGSGELQIDSAAGEIRYRLSLVQLFVVATVLIGIMLAFMLSAPFPRWVVGGFIPLLWLWLVGGNLMIGIPRFRSFLRRSVKSAPRCLD